MPPSAVAATQQSMAMTGKFQVASSTNPCGNPSRSSQRQCRARRVVTDLSYLDTRVPVVRATQLARAGSRVAK